MIACFVDLGGIDDRLRYVAPLFRGDSPFVDLGGIDDHCCLEVIVRSVGLWN